ncbi:MAG: nitrilase-related carbon-nitrogen hydrolase [Chloroflexota bacterium]|nr:carbon-nitrogen hydrolase family protein [Dehalococcoidia bacterium]MDW8253797.1 nitrilase-related carbon-nitrogen hydrolase [Chloroflexota bacterium]
MADLAAQAAADNVRAVAVQLAPALLDVPANLDRVLAILREEAAEDAALVVFPECTLSGYVIESREEAARAAISVPGPEIEQVAALCRELALYTVVGFLEAAGDRLYNSAALIGPEGLVGLYRKAHLPRVGVDRYVDPGDLPFTVHQTAIGKIGMLICYDLSFPEAIRCLALDGMEVLAHPTNSPTGTWGPPGSRPEPPKSDPNASRERVTIISADRCGIERGIEFTGGSRIAGPSGRILARAQTYGEERVRAVIHPARSRSKRVVIAHLPLEVDYHADRRPDLYGRLVQPNR